MAVEFPEWRPSQRGVGGNAFASGFEVGNAMRRRRMENEAQQYIEPALGGDQAAFGKLAAANPQVANSIATMLGRLDEKKKAVLKDAADFTTAAGMGVLSSAEADQPAAYQTALGEAKRRGYDTTSWPQQWSPAARGWLQYNVNRARPVKDYFDSQNAGVAPIGPPAAGGGGGAPAPTPSGGKSNADAIAGIESGGRYDAVGPETGKGRAYGKYQVMDFNIGPWTREILGTELTPQQFLASPQAQDAVFNAKFGAYEKKYGREGAARAWFAGEGGMSNPNAADVNGMTVQRYGQKFAQAGGAPQPTMGAVPPQVAQAGANAAPMPAPRPGMAVPGNPAQMPQPPAFGGAAPPNATGQGGDVPPMPGQMPVPPDVRGVNLPPGARMVGPKSGPNRGVPITKDGTVLIQKQDGSLDWVPLPQRKEPAQAGGGPFAGTGMDQQAYNIILQGDPSSPAYAAAYAHLSSPRVQFDAQSGQMITIRPNMDWARPPLGMATPPSAPPAPGAAQEPAPQPNAVQIPGGGTATVTPALQRGPSQQEMAKLREARAEAEKITKAGEDFVNEWKKAGLFDRAKSMTGATTNLNTAYNNFALLAKGETLFNLGVLNGPDLEIIRRTLPDPSQIKSGIVSEAEVEAAVGKVLDILRNSVSAKERQLPGSTAPAKPAEPTQGPAEKEKQKFDMRKKYGLE